MGEGGYGRGGWQGQEQQTTLFESFKLDTIMAGLAQRKHPILKATQIKEHGDSEVFDILCLLVVYHCFSRIITHPVDNPLSPKERNENKVAGSKEGGQGYTVMELHSHSVMET